MSKVSEGLARPARTGGQFGAAEVTVQVIEAFFAELSTAQHVALLGALTLLYGFLQVVLENRTGFALLRTIPAPNQAEVVSTEDRDQPGNLGHLMARYPDALWRPLPENKTEPLIQATQFIFHSAVSKADSLWGYFNSKGITLESHFYMQDDGDLEQYIDTARQADANYQASVRAISVETWDNRNPDRLPWSGTQVERLARLALWAHRTHGIPLVRAPRWDAPGMGGHSDFPGRWTNVKGKTCPGLARRPQVDIIIRRARVLNGQVPTNDQEVDEMALKRGDKGRAVSAFQRYLAEEATHQKRPIICGVDGDFGPNTEAALKQYQTAAQLPATGVLDGVVAALLSTAANRR